MTTYAEQIAFEKQKIAMFQSKIEQCEKRILSLNFLMEDSNDDLDAMASYIITASSNVRTTYSPPTGVKNKNDTEEVRSPRKRLANNTIKLLMKIGKEGIDLKDLVKYARENNLDMTDQNIRNFAMIYRRQYGYIENPRKGFYRLTDAGNAAIESIKSESLDV